MGKGDGGSRRGKIWRGSYGNTRPHKTDKNHDNDKKPQKSGLGGRKGK